MHHKRKRRKKARAGCFLCYPHKMNGQRNGFEAQTRQEQKSRISEREQLVEVGRRLWDAGA